MGWIVLTVLLMICAIVGVGYAIYSKKVFAAKVAAWEAAERRGSTPMNYSLIGWGGAGVAASIWVLLSLFLMAHTVGQREVAIVYNFSGTISGKKDPGIVTTWPWQHVKKENVGILHDEWDFGQGNYAVSLDQQRISALLAVNYQIESKNVVDLYKRVGSAWKTIIIDSRVPQVFKEVTSKYPTAEITANREQLRIDTKARLTEELSPYDIHVVDVFVKNLGFSEEYTKSIEAKQKQVQDALRQEAKIRESKAIANQKVETALGEAKANVARARGDATANRLRQQSLTPLLVQLRAIETLNPGVQTIICPPQSVCIPGVVTPVPAGTTP